MRFYLCLVTFIACCLAHSSEWKKIRQEGTINVFSKEIKGSNLMAFKAEGFLKVPYAKALAILRDVEESTAWDQDLKKKVTIENVSDIEAITYSIVDMPWPLKDRDMVLHNLLLYDKKTNELVVTSKSISHPKAPAGKDYIRANLRFANMRFLPYSNDVTRLQMEIHVDPKGSVPDWVINWVQKDMPVDFIQRLISHTKVYKKGPNKGVWDMMQVQKKDLEKQKKSPASITDNN